MSLLSSLYAFLVSSAEAILPATTVAKVTDAFDTQAAGLGDGATDLYFVANAVDAGDSATGASYLIELKTCDTSGGTYTTVLSKTVPLATVKALGEVMRSKLPNGLLRYLKVSITGAASMTGGSTFKAYIATS